jgi:hypothetical protein
VAASREFTAYTLFYMNMRGIARLAVTLSALLLAAGCASKDPYLVSDNARSSPCPPDLTYSCVEYLGKKLRCYCANRDELREVLEPQTRQ